MAGHFASTEGVDAYEYVFSEGDTGEVRSLALGSDQRTPWIDSSALKLRHRIGRGPFGDVWLATHHQSTNDYDEFHEVAVKMLHPVSQDHVRVLLDKFNDVFSKCEGIGSVCKLQGVSVISGKICIIMKFYEGSVGDKMARLKRGRLPVADVLRYGVHLAQGIAELHSKGTLLLNLKPFNFLLNENDHAILGDFGIPYLLLGIPFSSSDEVHRLGTPNYMAPEQWQPEERGPISFETDSWGFACSILEMLTGIQPWRGKSCDEIYDLVVGQHEKPAVPFDLPPSVHNVLLGCFEYDFRSRPLLKDILNVFMSSQSAPYDEGTWLNLGWKANSEKSSNLTGYTEWFVSKDDLQVGDIVRSRKPRNSCKFVNMDIPEGTVVGLEDDRDSGSFALVRVHGIHDPLRVHVSTLERVTLGLVPGDWVRLKYENKKLSRVGILHSIDRSGKVTVGFIGMGTLWTGSSSDLQMAESYCIGQFVRLKSKVISPRFDWPHKSGGAWAAGRISWVCPNGCLVVKFPGRLTFGDQPSSFLADPAEVEAVTFNNCPGMVEKYHHLEDFHWAVRPILASLGFFTAVKVGFCVCKKMQSSKAKRQVSAVEGEIQNMEGQSHSQGPATWQNILFRGDAAL